MDAAKICYPNILIRKNHGTSFATAGDPDLYGCLNGRAFAIEMKRPGEKPTKLQEQRLREWATAGAYVGIAHSAEEMLGILDSLVKTVYTPPKFTHLFSPLDY